MFDFLLNTFFWVAVIYALLMGITLTIAIAEFIDVIRDIKNKRFWRF